MNDLDDLDPLAAEPLPEDGEGAPAEQQDDQGRSLHEQLLSWINTRNIAEEMSAELLGAIGQRVKREYDIDLNSRSDWEDKSKDAMDLAMQVAKAKTFPWPNSSNVIYPLMTTAAVQFAARAYPAIVQGRNVVKGVVVGNDKGLPQMSPQDGTPMMRVTQNGAEPIWSVPPGAKRQRADRIGEHMSWQLLEEMTEWEEETDKLLHILPIIGCAFRKSYFDPGMGCNSSVLVMPMNVVINYWAKSMERAPRISEDVKFYPNEVEELIRAGLFIDQAYRSDDQTAQDDDAPVEFIEQHRWLDLDEDGYAEPYIVTVHKSTTKVARIVARYDADGIQVNTQTGEIARIEPVHYYTKYDFLPNPEGGIYGVGFGQLLAPINQSVNTCLNQMFDAGTQQNTGGGFIGRGLSMHSGSVKFRPGEYKVVNAPGSTVRDAIVPLQFNGPSPVLFQLLGFLVEAGREVASVKDVLSGDSNPNMQPTTLLAMIEQGLKVFTAIYKRVHRAAKKEYDKLYRLNRVYLEHQSQYKIGDEWKTITREDYAKGSGVVPVSDPTMVSDMQRLAKAQFLQLYQNDPLCDGATIRRRVFEAAQIEAIDEILQPNPPPNPELMAQAAELQLKGEETQAKIATERAKQIHYYATSIKALADADKASVDSDIGWAQQQMEYIRLRMEGLNGKAVPQLPAPSQAGGGVPGAMPTGEQPPMEGARQGRDGAWYVEDVDRPGKFLKVAA